METPYSTQPSPNIDLIFGQRKQFLDVPEGQVMLEAVAYNLAANSLEKEVFTMKIGPFASPLRIFKFIFLS